MPHARAPRAERRQRAKALPYLEPLIPREAKAALPMVQSSKVVQFPRLMQQQNRRENLLPTLSQTEIETINTLIDRRYEAASPITDEMAVKMDRLEAMYRGEWLDASHDEEEHIYLAKAREALQVVHAFLYGMVLQVPKLVSFRPTPTSLVQVTPMWRSAKLGEALTNYYFEDIWDIRHGVLRDFIKMFLKFPVGILRVDYLESDVQPDLRFTLCDRALQYIDPHCHRIKDAGWWIEKEFWSRSAIEEMFATGHWDRPPDLPDSLPTLISTGTDDAILRRFFGSRHNSNIPVESDDLVEVWFYRQARGRGIDDVYAVKLGGIGGWLVRYGPNPFPGPDIPYCGDSFDRHEFQVDGHGLLEMHEALQEIINTVLNLRLDDLRESLWSPVGLPANLVTEQTKEDIEDRQKFVRFNQDLLEQMRERGVRLGDLIEKIPINDKESTHLYQDLAFLLGQNQSVGHSSDVFRGQTPSKVTTAQEIQEALSNNQGVFRPAFMSIMKTVEDAAQIALSYFRDPDFFGEERIILATGGRYQDVIRQWDVDDGDVRAAAVRFDDMQVDVSINAINGADAMMARTFRAAVVKEMLASIGQVDGMFEELRDRFDFVPLIIELFRDVVTDIDSIERSEEEAQQRAQNRMQQQQQQTAQGIQLEALRARAQEEAKGAREQQTIQVRASADAARDAMRLDKETANAIREIVAEANATERKELRLMFQEHLLELQRMQEEQRLEIEAQTKGADSKVGPGQQEVKSTD
jgi:hypothetical protein